MKILYTPNLIAPSLTDDQRSRILAAAGPGARIVDAKDPAKQREEIVDTDMLFGRVSPEIYVLNKWLRYHSIGAGVDAILTQDLVETDVILASEKGDVGIHLAEHALALLLALTRGLHTAIRKSDYTLREPIRREQWELYDKTMGIVGSGARAAQWPSARTASACVCSPSTSLIAPPRDGTRKMKPAAMYGTGVRLSQVAGNISQPPIVRLKGTGLLMTTPPALTIAANFLLDRTE